MEPQLRRSTHDDNPQMHRWLDEPGMGRCLQVASYYFVRPGDPATIQPIRRGHGGGAGGIRGGVAGMADAIFEEPRLAQVYDPLDPDRSDLDVYVAMVDEFGARSVLDIGCGTGTFACMLVSRGIEVTAVDPAAASLNVAQTKAGADRVRWVHGYATDLGPLHVDAVFMTANVAQVFLTDEEWHQTLSAAFDALRPGGRLVFETRDPAARAWEGWTPDLTRDRKNIPEVGVVEHWNELLRVSGELVTFRGTVVFESDGAVFESESTLRFRSREAIESSLTEAGFVLEEVRDAPDRPGKELVFIARRGRAISV